MDIDEFQKHCKDTVYCESFQIPVKDGAPKQKGNQHAQVTSRKGEKGLEDSSSQVSFGIV